MKNIQSICVYCGSSPGTDPAFIHAAQALGKSIAEHDIRLVYGGGTNGLMGAVADAVTQNGGKVTGIIPEFLLKYEASEGSLDHLDELEVVEDMHTRKHMMFDRSDAFVTLPGGIGTLEEVIEMMTWAQLGRHKKPIVLANIKQFWNPLIALHQHMVEQGFVRDGHGGEPLVIDTAEDIVPAILAHHAEPAANSKIIDKL